MRVRLYGVRLYGIDPISGTHVSWMSSSDSSGEAYYLYVEKAHPDRQLWTWVEYDSKTPPSRLHDSAGSKTTEEFYRDCVQLIERGNFSPTTTEGAGRLEANIQTWLRRVKLNLWLPIDWNLAFANAALRQGRLVAPTTTKLAKPPIAQCWYDKADKAKLADAAMDAVRALSKGQG